MNFFTFASDIKQNALKYPVISFTGKNYPLLFFSSFLNFFKNGEHDTVFIHELPENLEELKAQLSISFLGNSSLYWLTNITDLDTRRKKALYSFLHSYTGPHAVWCFTNEPIGQTIELPEILDKKQFEQLAHCMTPEVAKKNKLFVTKLFAKTGTVPFEHACLLVRYQQLIGNRADYFINNWLNEIVLPDHSLFTLSSHFFAKKTELFLRAWHDTAREYPAQFWCAYWSEQLFRDYWYCTLMKAKQVMQAKKIGYRLPFSFLQKDWKVVSSNRLQTMHAKLYEIDYALKNGASEAGIFEPMFLHFLTSHYH